MAGKSSRGKQFKFQNEESSESEIEIETARILQSANFSSRIDTSVSRSSETHPISIINLISNEFRTHRQRKDF